MNFKSTHILVSLIVCCLISCDDSNEDVVNTPNKDGSVETVISTEHRNSYDLLITEHKVWVKGVLDTVLTKVDTLKNLGYTSEEASSENEDNDGKHVTVPKDYEIYITVK